MNKNKTATYDCEEELYDKLSEISTNFRNLEALLKCLDKLLLEELEYSESESANILDITQKLLITVKKQFQEVEDKLNL